MKTLSALIILALILLSGCSKDNGYTNAVITGYDNRMCACCGGLMINFNNNLHPTFDQAYDVANNPDSLGISLADTFPIYMRIKTSAYASCGRIIYISSYQR